MAHYSSLTRQDIEFIAADFGINDIGSFKVMSGGWENTNYLIDAKKGSFVLTLSEQKTEQETRDLARLLEYLGHHHFNTSRIIRSTGDEPITLWKGKPVLMKRFVEGRILKQLPVHLIELTGRELGKLHKIQAPEYLPLQLDYGKENFGEVQKYAANSAFENWLMERLEYISPHITEDLPRALIHSDVFTDNVIVGRNGDTVMIVDFEEAACYYRIFDIGMTIMGTCAEGESVNPAKVRSLLKGYDREISLLDNEISALQAFTVYAGAAMTFWRHRNFNFIKPQPALADHYLGLKVLTDFVEQQADDWFQK